MEEFFYYGTDSKGNLRLRHGTWYLQRSGVSELLICEQGLRELFQLEERLGHKVAALQKAADIEVDGTQLEEANQQLEETRKLRFRKEHSLYKWEICLHSTIKAPYDSLRCDDTWYMREELIKDCSAQGGCCGRQCGCCAERHSSRKNISGHCTVECGCCMNFRGFDLLETQKKEMRDDFREYIDKLNQPLLTMANGYFSPLKPKEPIKKPPEPQPWWKEILRLMRHEKK